LVVASLAVILEPALAFACSGSGAAETILRAERTGWLLWSATLVISIALVLTRRVRSHRARRNALVAIVVVHPGWWMGARGGGCGTMLVHGLWLVTVVAIVISAVAVFRSADTVWAPSRSDRET
jgi:hypothetical protein